MSCTQYKWPVSAGWMAVALFGVVAGTPADAASLHPDRGVSMIWYGGQNNLNDRNGVVENGQIALFWRSFEPTEGHYAFANLDAQLQDVHAKGMKTTIQVNGTTHPDYLFKLIPYLKKDYPGERDYVNGYGPLMYWHETYKAKYANMMAALANHLSQSPYKSAVLGIRHSPNAVGTEHYFIESADRSQANWTLEAGATWGGPWPWTTQVGTDYRTWTVDMYIDKFNPPSGLPVFMRASAISAGYAASTHLEMAETGQLMLFETSSEPQPREGKEAQYQVFVDYCKSGKTWGFTESWSEAVTSGDWGWTKTQTPISLDQFNYWALLVDLHCGSSFPARRPEDIDRSSFRSDYEFAAQYAGWQHEPGQAPGAWIAFREGDYLVGDYTYLMTHDTVGATAPLYNIDSTRYGLWARTLAAGASTTLSLDPAFSASLTNSTGVRLRVRYKDTNSGGLTLTAFGKEFSVQKTNSGTWKLAEFLTDVTLPHAQIQLQATGGELVVHMVEVLRGEAGSGGGVTVYEAENAAFFFCGTVKSDSAASAGSYVDGGSNFSISWEVDAVSGVYELGFRIKAPSGTRKMGLYINNIKVGIVTCSSLSWETSVAEVSLFRGINTIELRDSEGTLEPDIDYLSLIAFGAPPIMWADTAVSVSVNTNGMVVGWAPSNWVLEATANLVYGEWSEVAGATSPYVVGMTAMPIFFRTRSPLDTVFPVVSMLSPDANAAFPIDSSVTVEARVVENNVLEMAILVVDGVPTATNRALPFAWMLEGLSPGGHSVRVEAVDAWGNTSDAEVGITIGSAGSPP